MVAEHANAAAVLLDDGAKRFMCFGVLVGEDFPDVGVDLADFSRIQSIGKRFHVLVRHTPCAEHDVIHPMRF